MAAAVRPRLVRALGLAVVLACALPSRAEPWSRLVSAAGVDRPEALHLLPDGRIAVAGSSAARGASSDGWVFVLTADGELSWSRVLGAAGRDELLALALLEGGRLVAVGARMDDDVRQPWAVAFEPDGTVAWERTLFGERGELRAVLPAPGGGLLAWGQLRGVGLSLKMDFGGALQWVRRDAGVFTWVAATPAAGGGAWIAGDAGGARLRTTVLARIEPDGSVSELHGLRELRPRAVRELPGGGLALLEGFAAGILRLSSELELEWSRVLDDEPGGPPPGALAVAPDGDLLVVAPGEDVTLLRLAPDGTERWRLSHGGAHDDEGRAVAVTPEGEILVAGWVGRDGTGAEADALVLRLAGDGGSPACSLRPPEPLRLDALEVSAAAAEVERRDLTVFPSIAPSPRRVTSAVARGDCLACDADGFEPDDACPLVESVLLEGAVERRDFCDDDEDWMAIDVVGGATYEIAATSDAAPRPSLELWDDGCAAIEAAADGVLSWTAPSSGRWRLRVRPGEATPPSESAYELRLESDGAPCRGWSVLQSAPRWERPEALAPTPSGGLLVMGKVIDLSATLPISTPWVASLDAGGAARWSWSLVEPADARPEALLATPDGGGVAAFSLHSSETGSLHALAVAFDADGEVRWQARLGDDDSWTWPVGVVSSGGGGVLLVGTKNDAVASVQGRIWTAKLDAEGRLEWERLAGPAGSLNVSEVVAWPGAGAAVAGFHGSFDSFVARLDAEGRLRWSRRFDRAGTLPEGLVVTEAGRVIVGLGGPRFLELDSEGALLDVVAREASGVSVSATHLDALGEDLALGWCEADLVAATCTLARLGPDRSFRWSLSWIDDVSWDALALGADGRLLAIGEAPFRAGVVAQALAPDGTGGASCRAAAVEAPLPAELEVELLDLPGGDDELVRDALPLDAVLAPRAVVAVPGCPCERAGPPREVSAPGASVPLRVDAVRAGCQLSWQPRPEHGAETFRLYRGEITALPDGFACLAGGLSEPRATAEGTPPAGGWAYLVSGVNAFGEGPLGRDSTGTPRRGDAACP